MVLIAVAFAYAKVTDPNVRIIPVVLGIAGFILGPMLGVFLIGMFTKGRGSDLGNVIAITCGLIATVVCGDLHVTIANGVAGMLGQTVTFVRPDWLPKVSFTWFAMLGAVVVFTVGVLFPTPKKSLERAERRAAEADGGEDRPLALRQE
jgi:Na+/proline symporter